MKPLRAQPLNGRRPSRISPAILGPLLLALGVGAGAVAVEAQESASPPRSVILVDPHGVRVETPAGEEPHRSSPPEPTSEGTGTVQEANAGSEGSAEAAEVREGVTEHAATEPAVPAGPGTQ